MIWHTKKQSNKTFLAQTWDALACKFTHHCVKWRHVGNMDGWGHMQGTWVARAQTQKSMMEATTGLVMLLCDSRQVFMGLKVGRDSHGIIIHPKAQIDATYYLQFLTAEILPYLFLKEKNKHR